MIKLRSKVRDSISGFEGVVVSTTDYIYGCRRLVVQPMDLDKDGKIKEVVDQLSVVDELEYGNPKRPLEPTGGPGGHIPADRMIPKR